jgi:hypothetical protein
MDIDLMRRQIRSLIEWKNRVEPFLDEMMARDGANVSEASMETEPEALSETSDARRRSVPRLTERQPADDRSEPKTVGPDDGVKIAGAEQDRAESKPPGGANLSGSAKK